MPPRRALRISRFIVMAILQAARAEALGLPQKSAYSWGLNRAIFFAAAKRGFTAARTGGGEGGGSETRAKDRTEFFLGDEKAYSEELGGVRYFVIGEEPQTEKEFESQIVRRFGSPGNFRAAWTEAAEIIRSADPESLRSGHRFFSEVYRPRRDELSSKWTEQFVHPNGARPSSEGRSRPGSGPTA